MISSKFHFSVEMKAALILSVLFSASVLAHPAGNVIKMSHHVLWSYVSPVGDIEHHASVMLWDQKSKPATFLVSEYSGSSYFLFSKDETIYIVESRYDNSADVNMTRMLKTSLSGSPEEIWPWFEDESHIGNHGFYMISDTQIVYGGYPNIYIRNLGGKAEELFQADFNIDKIRYVNDSEIIVLSEGDCHLVSPAGEIIKTWGGLIDEKVTNAPLGRNMIYDVDYRDGRLLIANWGKRAFEIIENDYSRDIIQQHQNNIVPHWVMFLDENQLLFASVMDFDNPFNEEGTKTTIVPVFLMNDAGVLRNIWPQE